MAGFWSRLRLPLPGSGGAGNGGNAPGPGTGRTARDFDALVLPHLAAGYNLARWLLRDEHSAEDAVQDAAMRALRYFHALQGDNARSWFLGIVRNVCMDHLRRLGTQEEAGLEDDALEAAQYAAGLVAPDPAAALEQERQREQVNAAVRALPPAMREVIVLRELEGLDYAEIGAIAGIPTGTVMSRLSRARARLRETLAQPQQPPSTTR